MGPRNCEWRERAGMFGWLYSQSVLRSQCDNIGRRVGSLVGTQLDIPGGWIYIDGNDSRLRSERMHHGTRQKQVHATTTQLLTSTPRESVA